MKTRRAFLATGARCIALAACPAAGRSFAGAKGKTVSVWDFDNSSLPDGDAAPWIDSFQRVLPEALLAGFNRGGVLTTVERVSLRDVLSEQRLGASDLADDSARLRLGRIAGAQHMIFGTYMALGDQVRLDLRCVDVATSLIEYAETIEGKPDDVVGRMDATAQKIAHAVAGTAGKGGAAAADSATWRDYDRGLVLMDGGKYREAIDVFKQVLKRRPDFKPAEKQVALAAQRLSRQ